MIVQFGVIDMVYDYGEDPGKTTFEVAKDLEDHYGIMETFYKVHRADVQREVIKTLTNQLADVIQFDAPMPDEVLLSNTVSRFQLFLTTHEVETLGIPGTPTLAAIEGVNSRFKTRSDPGRPSFVDGGLYETSFQAWIEFND